MKFKVVYEYSTYIHSYIMYTKLLLIGYYLKLILYGGNLIIRICYSKTTRTFLLLQILHHYLAWSIVIHSIIDHINSIIYTL